MSIQDANDPKCHEWEEHSPIDLVIVPRARDIGDFEVKRALPSSKRQMIGPFIFFDQMGPAEFLTGKGIDVRPHPHIGLSTVTYLYEGAILHRDSLGNELPIKPGEVNWMTAGKGIAHSERTDPTKRHQQNKLFGIQTWVALPEKYEETQSGFIHYDEAEMPRHTEPGLSIHLVAGEFGGIKSPVKTHSDLVYADIIMDTGKRLPIDKSYEERAIYITKGEVEIAGDRHGAGSLLVFHPHDNLTITAVTDARFMLFGGEPMDGPRHLWWNFVSSSKERIEQAKADWVSGKFDRVINESEFIPLPER